MYGPGINMSRKNAAAFPHLSYSKILPRVHPTFTQRVSGFWPAFLQPVPLLSINSLFDNNRTWGREQLLTGRDVCLLQHSALRCSGFAFPVHTLAVLQLQCTLSLFCNCFAWNDFCCGGGGRNCHKFSHLLIKSQYAVSFSEAGNRSQTGKQIVKLGRRILSTS